MNYVITLSERMEKDLGYAMNAYARRGNGVVIRTGCALAKRGLVEVSHVGICTFYRITYLGIEVIKRLRASELINVG